MNKNNSQLIATILRRLAKEIESLSDDELKCLADQPARLLAPQAPQGRSALAKQTGLDGFDAASLVNSLRELSSREAGLALLQEKVKGKERLVKVAKVLDLPITNRLTTEQVLDKVIEATIGFRIRSAAIRGEPPI